MLTNESIAAEKPPPALGGTYVPSLLSGLGSCMEIVFHSIAALQIRAQNVTAFFKIA